MIEKYAKVHKSMGMELLLVHCIVNILPSIVSGGAFKTMPASPKSTKSISDSEYNPGKSQIKMEEEQQQQQQPFNKSSSSSIFTFPTDQVQFNALHQQQNCDAMALEQQRCNQQQIANENFLSQCNMLSKGKIVAIHLNNHQTTNHHHQIDNHELITTSVSNTNSTNSSTTITSTNLNNNNANNNIITKTATTITTSDVVQQPSSIVYETIIVENNNNNHHSNDNTTNTSLMTSGKISSSTTGGIVVLTNASLSELLNSGNDGSTTKEKLTIINDSSKKSLSQSILMINSGSLNTAVSSSGTVSASGTPIMATNQLTGQKQIMFLNNNQVKLNGKDIFLLPMYDQFNIIVVFQLTFLTPFSDEQQYLMNQRAKLMPSNVNQSNSQSISSNSSAKTPTSVQYVIGKVPNLLISTPNYDSNSVNMMNSK